MAAYKSPFYLVENFISPLICEDIIDSCNYTVPDRDIHNKVIKTIRPCESAEHIIYDRLMELMPDVEQHYGIQYKGTERIMFEWFPSSSVGEFICENSQRLRDKWVRTKNRDLSAILFLSDFQDAAHFDSEYEVYGGRLEFVQHRFSFKPQRGTLVIFPSDPHFINITTEVLAGDAYQARIQMTSKESFKYNISNFPGDYTKWF